MSYYNDLQEDLRQVSGVDFICVKTDNWHLMKAFKEACEEMGWKYCRNFTQFSQETFESMKRTDPNCCMYFSYEFDDMMGEPAFALSVSQMSSHKLPWGWDSALGEAKQMLERHKHVYRVELNEDYTAVVDTKKRIVTVGCQQFRFDKVLEIVDIFKKQK